MIVGFCKRHTLALLVGFMALGWASEVWAQEAPTVPPCQAASGRRTYNVLVNSSPPQAQVILEDGAPCLLGYTPWQGRLRRGRHNIRVAKDGYEDARQTVNVRRRRRVQEFSLAMVKKPDPPRIEVSAAADQNVFNAAVWIDGQSQGQAPVIVTVVDGRHLVEVRKEGFEDFQQWVEVKEGERRTLNPVLKATEVQKVGTILVEADVPGASVIVDGTPHPDQTPTLITGLPEGPHIVEVRKDPAMPWRQTVMVVADQTTKVSAQLVVETGPAGGTVRVLSNVEDAQVLLDGSPVGSVPVDVKDVSPGEHFVEVRAPGYLSREERITVSAGSAVLLKLDLQAEAEARDTGIIKVVSAVPEGKVFIDGENVGMVPQERELPAGEHFVVVEKDGYKKFEEKVNLEAGQTITITAELAAVGSLRVLSTPSGADVLLDGESVGSTPLNIEDVDVGSHVVTVQLIDYYDFEQALEIQGGERSIVSARLEAIDTGPTPEDLQREQRALSSFGGRALALGRSTISFGAGYPYYFDGQFTVGAGDLGAYPFDVGVVLRTYFSRTEIAVKSRLTFFDQQPFSFAAFVQAGGGSNFFDESGRNTFFTQLGGLASLSAFGSMTVTGRAFFDLWSDRHCPEVADASNTDELDICTDMTVTDVRDRDNGARFMLSFIVEVALWQRWSLWGYFEGPPGQVRDDGRRAYDDRFSPLLLSRDRGFYGRMGASYKF